MNSSISIHSVLVATKHQVSCALGDESAILNMDNSVYYGMNAVGTSVWNLLQQPRSLLDIRDAIVDEYDVTPEQCERDLLELLEEMKKEGLVELSDAAV
jgi:Coenzyme PQQ synthesis protein D (PqqD)